MPVTELDVWTTYIAAMHIFVFYLTNVTEMLAIIISSRDQGHCSRYTYTYVHAIMHLRTASWVHKSKMTARKHLGIMRHLQKSYCWVYCNTTYIVNVRILGTTYQLKYYCSACWYDLIVGRISKYCMRVEDIANYNYVLVMTTLNFIRGSSHNKG